MNENIGDTGQMERLRFFGRITASVTHEINNVFSVINENSGLLSDMAAASKKGKGLDQEKVKKLCDTVQRQIDRGQEIVKRLNLFAHATDERVREFDLTETVKNMVMLTNRFAYRKRAELDTVIPDSPISMRGEQFMVQQAVFNGIMTLLSDAGSGDHIEIKLLPNGDGAKISITGPPFTTETAGNDHSVLEWALEELGGDLSEEPEKGSIEFTLPGEGS